MNVSTITATELGRLCQSEKSPFVIDVRTPVEFREVHAELARNVPLDTLNPSTLRSEREGHCDGTIYFICRSGSRGRQACEKLMTAGFSNVVNVEGGTLAWVEAGLPVVRGQKAISLERQVRIAAGSLVVLGVLLAQFVHPYWDLLPVLVGGGLIFAGITDKCAMGTLLARMPWNQVSQNSPASSCCASS